MNVYYQPEAFGLEVVAELESGHSYEFDTIVVWRHNRDGTLYWAHDEGCSCPTPFEDFAGLPDLWRFDPDAIRRMVQERADYGTATAEERASFLRQVEELV